jgi:hypothetical protein
MAALPDTGIAGKKTFFLEDRTISGRIELFKRIGDTRDYRFKLTRRTAAS